MSSALADLSGVAETMLWHSVIVFFRVGAMVSVLPGFGSESLPVRIKLGAALAFTMIVAPSVPLLAGPQGLALEALVLFVFSETVSGLFIGITLRLFVLALQTAGSIAAQSTSLSQLLGGAASEPLPAMGHVLVVSGLALAMMLGLHVQIARYPIVSYDMLPAGQFAHPALIAEWGGERISRAFSLAFVLAAPFVVISTLYNLMLGVINRAMPQLMVAFVGAPLITAGGVILLFVLAPPILTVWMAALTRFLDNPAMLAP